MVLGVPSMVAVAALYLVVAAAKEWSLVEGTAAATLAGVGGQCETCSVGAAAQNGVGAVVERYDGESWTKEPATGAGMLLDADLNGDLTVATSVLPILISKDGGNSYNTVDALGGASQSATITSDNVISLVGSFIVPSDGISRMSTVTGVARSADSGDSWTLSSVPDGYSRYGAFPSENVWYVANGIWGEDPQTPEDMNAPGNNAVRSFLDYRLSARAAVNGIQKGGITFYGPRDHGKSDSNSTTTGWFGSISKTTDGGKTWETVFESNRETDYYYFNSISCSSETHCVAVAEGDDAETGGYLVRAYVTFDGGNTWTNALTTDNTPENMVSIMGSGWINDQEGWLGGTSKSGRNLSGVFFRTTDGGKTYTVDQTLDNCFMIDMRITSDGAGYAACSSSSGSSCSIAIYA